MELVSQSVPFFTKEELGSLLPQLCFHLSAVVLSRWCVHLSARFVSESDENTVG